jgi:hypothetical protein
MDLMYGSLDASNLMVEACSNSIVNAKGFDLMMPSYPLPPP